MSFIQRRSLFLIFFIFIIAITPLTLAKERFFDLEKVKPGMKGTGYSVFSGTKIESFDVKVLAVVEGDIGRDKLILVKLSGKRLTESGGLAAGMSGSPVYIKGSLVGAISYGFENADSFLALVTPIESMLKLMSEEEKTVLKKQSLNLGSYRIKPVTSPVIVTGMGRRSFNLLKEILESQNFSPVFTLGSKQSKVDPGFVTLKPGSAVAVQMVSGDYQVSAIGTVTMVEGNQFLAFGHSFTNKGKVDYLAFQAHILQTIKSPVMSFKIGLPLQRAGRIVEDRQEGILGRFGEFPELIPVTVIVKDSDRNFSRTSSFQVIHNEQMYRDLIVSGVTDAIDQTIDRVGSGTATVEIKAEFVNRNEPLIRNNIFYGKDIAVSCLQDLRTLLDIISNNEFAYVLLKSIQVTVTVQEKQVSARIVRVETEQPKAKPGEKVKMRVILHSYRGQDFAIPFEIKLPANIEPGKLTITVRAGAKTISESGNEERKKDSFKSTIKEANSFEELINDFIGATRNNQIIMEYQINENTGTENKNLKNLELKSDASYYIYGDTRFDLEIIQPAQ